MLNRSVLICNAPDLVQFAFSTHNASFERKSPQMRHALQPLLGDGLFISDGDIWRRRRKIVAPIIHVSRMAEFAPVMVETLVETRERWAGLADGAPIDALSEMAELTAEIICRTIFGAELGRDHAREVVEGFSQYQRAVGQLDVTLPPRPAGLASASAQPFSQARDRPHPRRARAHHRRLPRPGGRAPTGSVIGHLLEARDEETGRPLDRAALRNEAAVIFMAGHETTANTLAWAWFLLSQAPEAEARLHRELDEVLGGRPPTLTDLPRLPYARAP